MNHIYTIILGVFLFCCPIVSYSQSAFYSLGEDYANSGNYEEAIRLTKMSLNMDLSNLSKDAVILDYCALCEYFSYMTQPDSCLFYADKAISYFPQRSGEDYLSVLRIISPHLRRTGLCQKAIDFRMSIIDETIKTYGTNSSRLLNEYRIMSSYSIDNEDYSTAIEYAKKEENLAFQLYDVTDNFEYRIPYDESLGWLRYVLQMFGDPTAASRYMIHCLDIHRDAISEEQQQNTFNCLAAISRNEEEKGNYNNAVQIRKLYIEKEKSTKAYIDDIASIARCYSNTNQNDSTILYCKKTNELAEQLINVADSIAEEYIQSTAWCLYRCGEYDLAVESANKVLSLREKIYGKGSPKHLEWFGVLSYNALQNNDLYGLILFCNEEAEVAIGLYGIKSDQFKGLISSVRGYAHQLLDETPEFIVNWTLPYYRILIENNILPKYQYEYEILLLEGFLSLGDLQSADMYYQRLEKWTYSSYNEDVPLEDKVRIWLKLAKYDQNIGDQIKARWRLMESDKQLSEVNQTLSITQLIDRHNVELNLRMDSQGRTRINAEWLIETSTPVIEAHTEDPETISFFYNSRAWAYEGLEEYDNAIDDINKSIALNPLYSRIKKLGQLYMQKSDYKQAEKIFTSLYNDKSLPKVGKESIEADLMALYWLMGDKDKMAHFMNIDIENVKKDTRNAFAFLNEKERETFLENSLLGTAIYFDMYTSFSSGENQWAEGNRLAYNLALIQKGLLLNTTREIKQIINSVPDSLQNDLRMYNDLQAIESIPNIESSLSREIRTRLMRYVVNQPTFMTQLNVEWTDVAENLSEGEAAIEFINLLGVRPNQMDDSEPSLGALVLRKGLEYPIFIKLTSNEAIVNLFEYDDEQERISDVLYSGEAKKMVYNKIWGPLLPHLQNVKTVYYSPVGVLQEINLDWIGYDDEHNISDDYNLYRVSSTREMCNKDNPILGTNNAVLYGDISYTSKSSTIIDLPKSKYRSTTRAGFSPLSKTGEEIDSIALKLNLRSYLSVDYRNNAATEESFRSFSGNSPKVIHIATHGFYYSKEAIEKEYQHGNFIAFQGMNPELYHSGLALSGAHDTWTYSTKPEELAKYFEMDSNNDGILLSAEISNMDLSNTDLVVLSACETALGNVTSEGVYGLQRAFKLAGVNSIMMSLWKVDDDATQFLMTTFYDNYLNGMSKQEALLSAQRKLSQMPGFEHPYNWAAFVLLDAIK